MKINKRRQRHLTSDPAAAIDPAATCCCDKSVAMATQHTPTSTAPSVSFGLPIWKVQRSLNDSIVCPSATFVHRLATTSRCVARPLPVVNIPQFTTKRAAVQKYSNKNFDDCQFMGGNLSQLDCYRRNINLFYIISFLIYLPFF